ncbi:MAG TPA: hypothetical protein VGQ51_14430 [Puia sp.]|jgi:hypothetical protein|nr:hypothetical protein [Puia sp.]
MRFKQFSLVTLSTLIVLTAGVTSCSKSGGGSSVNGVTATVGSTGFSPAISVAFYTESGAMWEVGGYTIKSGDTTALVVSIPSPVTVNTKMSTTNSAIGVEYYISGSNKDYLAGPGWGSATLTVTSLDTTGHKIAGNFTGTLYNAMNSNDSIKVTNGQFNTSYLLEP